MACRHGTRGQGTGSTPGPQGSRTTANPPAGIRTVPSTRRPVVRSRPFAGTSSAWPAWFSAKRYRPRRAAGHRGPAGERAVGEPPDHLGVVGVHVLGPRRRRHTMHIVHTVHTVH